MRPPAFDLILRLPMRRWPAFVRLLAVLAAREAVFRWRCWRIGASPREVRRMGRLYRLAGIMP